MKNRRSEDSDEGSDQQLPFFSSANEKKKDYRSIHHSVQYIEGNSSVV